MSVGEVTDAFVPFPEEVAVDTLPRTGRAVGIDPGVPDAQARSDGECIKNPHHLQRRAGHRRQPLTRRQ